MGKLKDKIDYSNLIPKSDNELIFSQWHTGRDVPLTWNNDELNRIEFSIIKVNFFRGNISKEQYNKAKLKFREKSHV